MSAFILTDAEIYVDDVDLTGYANTVKVSESVDVKDATTFASDGWAENHAGRKTAMFDIAGFLDWPSPGTDLAGNVGSSHAWIVAATDDANGSFGGDCWAGTMLTESFDQTIDHGDLGKYTTTATSAGNYGAGFLLMPSTSFSGDTSSLIANFTAGVLTGESLGLVFNVFTAGTTVDVDVISSAVVGMTSPTTEISETVTTTGGLVSVAAGPITNTYFRVDMSSVTGTFVAAAAVFIQK